MSEWNSKIKIGNYRITFIEKIIDFIYLFLNKPKQ